MSTIKTGTPRSPHAERTNHDSDSSPSQQIVHLYINGFNVENLYDNSLESNDSNRKNTYDSPGQVQSDSRAVHGSESTKGQGNTVLYFEYIYHLNRDSWVGSLHRFDPLSLSELQSLGHTSHGYMRDSNEGSSGCSMKKRVSKRDMN